MLTCAYGSASVAVMTDPAALPTFGLPPASGPPPALPLRDRVVAALRGAGHRPAVDEDGDVAVTVQEQLLFVRCVDSVPPLMRVFGQWLMDDVPCDELARLRAANAVTASVNLAKATVDEDRLAVAVDLLAGDDFHLPSLLDASLDAVLGCVRSWHATVLQLAVDSTALPAPAPTGSACRAPGRAPGRAPEGH